MTSSVSNGIGLPETINPKFLNAGNYQVLVLGSGNEAQMYRLDLTTSIPEPTGVMLALLCLIGGTNFRIS